MSNERARRLITESCLIASDVDKTILTQDKNERREFLTTVAPLLTRIASRGAQFAFLTGNSMNELTTRFLDLFVGYLCEADSLHLVGQFHFFCNAGGVYVHIPADDHELLGAVESSLDRTSLKERVLSVMTQKGDDRAIVIAPRFVDSSYLSRTAIPDCDRLELCGILERQGAAYIEKVGKRTAQLAKMYDLGLVTKDNRLVRPWVEDRKVLYEKRGEIATGCVQVTLKPILSYHQGLDERKKLQLAQRDARRELIEEIQAELDKAGLGRYEARGGGRSSIDVTLRKLDKAYGLEFLIDKLNLQGHAASGGQFASNVIYLGDEVLVGGGNDYPVTRLPGLLVFAVNSERELVPFQSTIYVPSSLFWGPEATADVLGRLDRSTRDLVERHGGANRAMTSRTAIEEFKRALFVERISQKIGQLRDRRSIAADDWQTLHAFVTLLEQEDAAARAWLSIFGRELDAVMAQMQSHATLRLPAIGSSRDET
jgi:hydroxymethylpyrimidine pyrophosphatase-like HAD family hydrolase